MADHKNCKWYEDCEYRERFGDCAKICTQYRNVDVVEVVRCKDCAEFQTEDKKNWGYCSLHKIVMALKGFCSYGERKEE